ncbi:MAG: biliverdin-producing heme oxygenase [Pseudomonadota bacterium]
MHSAAEAQTSSSRPRQVRSQAIRRALRTATQTDHERVDGSPLMRRLLHVQVCRADYGRALERLTLLHTALCGELARSISDYAHPQLRAQDLLPALRLDLAALQWTMPRAAGSTPQFATGAEALGAWYVLEGAALGGAVIARHLREQLGPDLPLRHFDGRGERRWPDFLRHLESCVQTDREIEDAILGAQTAYRFTAEILES